jgi:hypothetical protein
VFRGEIILSKALGFALVVLFLWFAGRKLRDIGLHSKGLAPSLLIGVSVTLLALVVGYTIELMVLSGSNPSLQFAAIDPKAGVAGRPTGCKPSCLAHGTYPGR